MWYVVFMVYEDFIKKKGKSFFAPSMLLYISPPPLQAMNLARELTKFPQGCLRADRASAFHATFASKTLEQSLQFECENAVHIIDAVS